MRKICNFAFQCTIVACSLAGGAASVIADEVELFFPGGNVSSKPILEFRARSSTLRPLSAGHAFVFLGREVDNDNIIFSRAAGFYPEHDTIKNTLLGPGKVKYNLPDMHADKIFRVHITEDQADLVNYILDNWDTKQYSIAWQNCVSLERDVARSIGLVVPEFNPGDSDNEIPSKFVDALRAANIPDAPIKFDQLETKRMEAVRNNRNEELKNVNALLQGRLGESRKRMDRIRQSSTSGRMFEGEAPGGSTSQPSGGPTQGTGSSGSGDPTLHYEISVPPPSR